MTKIKILLFKYLIINRFYLQKFLKNSGFKEKLAAFSMKTTDSKDLAKVNQILPIMQEYFGKSMNLARIKLMAYMLHALCVVQTVSLHKLASAMPTIPELQILICFNRPEDGVATYKNAGRLKRHSVP